MRLLQNKVLHGLGGFVLMAGCAAFANRNDEMPTPAITGMVQGILKAKITLFLKHLIECIFRQGGTWRRLALPLLTACAASPMLLSSFTLSLIHPRDLPQSWLL